MMNFPTTAIIPIAAMVKATHPSVVNGVTEDVVAPNMASVFMLVRIDPNTIHAITRPITIPATSPVSVIITTPCSRNPQLLLEDSYNEFSDHSDYSDRHYRQRNPAQCLDEIVGCVALTCQGHG